MPTIADKDRSNGSRCVRCGPLSVKSGQPYALPFTLSVRLFEIVPYLKTVLTYHLPSEAEVDKSLLESHGLTVNLLNNNEARNELGAPFHIQLQVPDEQHAQAVAVIRELNPQRFGSVEKVRKIERELGRNLLQLVGISAVVTALLWFCTRQEIVKTVVEGVIIGLILALLLNPFRRDKH